MPAQITVQVDRQIASIGFLEDSPSGVSPDNAGQTNDIQPPDVKTKAASKALAQNLETQIELFSEANDTLNALIARLNQHSNEIFTKHKEEIAKLSVEIARKILAQRIDKGDYDIEHIVKEAINNAPTSENLVVHVNPEDLALLKLACGRTDRGDNLDGVKLFADTKIGRAECLVESPKGLIESRISEQLEQVANALKKAQ